MRVRYVQDDTRAVPYFAAFPVIGPAAEILVSYVHQAEGRRWAARLRSDTQDKAVGGWLRCGDAARWLLIFGQFCQEPRADQRVA